MPLIDLRTGERLAGRIASLDEMVLKLQTATSVLSIPRRDMEAIWFETPRTQVADELVPQTPPQKASGLRFAGAAMRWVPRCGSTAGSMRKVFGLRAPATLEIPVPAGARWLVASIGPDADAARFARMTLEVLVDGKQAVACEAASPGQAARRVALSVKNAGKVVLSVKSAGADPTGCLGDFADVFFIY